MQKKYCNCAEGFVEISGVLSRVAAHHDCEYIAQRNALIPQADAEAIAMLEDLGIQEKIEVNGKLEVNEEYGRCYTNFFSRAMERAWRKK